MRNLLALLLLVPCMVMAQPPSYVPTDGLVAFFPLDGNSNDVSGFGNHGTNYGSSYTQDRFGTGNSAVHFNGSSYISVGHSESLNIPTGQDISWSVWVRTTPSPAAGSAFEKWNNNAGTSYSQLMLRREANGEDFVSGGYCTNSAQNLTGTVSWTTSHSVWHHIALRTSSGVTELYLDGALVSSQNSIQSGCSNSFDLHIGRRPGTSSRHFLGDLDDFGIWNRALSEAEIQALFLGEAPEYGCTDPAACNYDNTADADDGSCEYGCLYCGEGTVWDSISSTCVPAILSGDIAEDCTMMNLQELAQNHLLLVDQLATADSLLAICNGTADAGTNAPWTCGAPLTYWDYDYATVLIGDQCWFAENLRTDRYSDGEEIPGISDQTEWSQTNAGAHCFYGNDSLSHFEDIGLLYNWFATVDSRGVCPSGWHVPDDSDFISMEIALGMSPAEANSSSSIAWRGTDQGDQIKANPSMTPGWDGTNTSGFGFLPAGTRGPYSDSEFSSIGLWGWLWCTNSTNSSVAVGRALTSSEPRINRTTTYQKRNGFSVRCIKD